VVGLVDGPDRRWEVSGVESEGVRSVVHGEVITEDERRRTCRSTVLHGRSKS
jgi:hypothetical protein